jgi:hypothetical protein
VSLRQPERAAPEADMSTSITAIDQLDYDISLAYIALGVARSAWAHCPSAENTLRVVEAERDVDALLDERLLARA